MKTGSLLQDTILNRLQETGETATVFLMNGFQLHGVVTAFDNFSVLLESDGKEQLVYKHAISTLVPEPGGKETAE